MSVDMHTLRAIGKVFAIMFVLGVGTLVAIAADDQLRLEPLRSKAWAEMVADCEAHGGVAVPRATRVLGRSAEIPACVPQLSETRPK